MKKFFFILLALVILAPTKKIQASHLLAGEITYRHLSGNDYEVQTVLYRDCSSNFPAPNVVSLNISSSCGSFFHFFSKVETDTLEYCQGIPTTCQGGILPGVEWYLYKDTIQLIPCSDWEFVFSVCCRNPSNNIINSVSEPFYLMTSLNNSIAENSSPIFNQSLNMVAEINTPFCINNNSFDMDADSLVYTLVNPLGVNGVPINFETGYTVNQPFGSNVNFLFNSLNGNICFTPDQIGNFVVAVQIDEYRSGSIVGSTIRDIQVTVVNGVSVGTQDIIGTLYDDLGNPVSGIDVDLFEYAISQGSLNLISTQTTDGNGDYSFLGQNVEQYLLRAQASTGYMPTYHQSTAYWQHAQVIYSLCDVQITANITYVDTTNPMGTGVISGYLNGSGVFRAGDPIEGVNILIYDLGSDELVQNSITDANGYYELQGLLDGSYYILVDVEGLAMISTHFFYFSDGEIIENANFFASEDGVFVSGDYEVIEEEEDEEDEDEEEEEEGSEQGEEEEVDFSMVDVEVSSFNLFPNPGENSVLVEDTEGKSFSLSIYSVSGKKLKSINANKSEIIDVSDFESGVYIFNITQENRSKIIKWVKH